jgi:hypothetical protein
MIELNQPGHSKTPTSVDTGAEPTSTSSHDLQEDQSVPANPVAFAWDGQAKAAAHSAPITHNPSAPEPRRFQQCRGQAIVNAKCFRHAVPVAADKSLPVVPSARIVSSE